MSYAERTKRPPRTPTDDEIKLLLKISGAKRDDFRDHLIFSVAVGTGLREGEIVALDVGDVRRTDGKPRRSVQLRYYARKGTRKKKAAAAREEADAQIIHFPDGTYYKLQKYLRRHLGLMLRHAPDDRALFEARGGRRLSVRRVRELFREWQIRAGFDNLYPFHALRHYAITNAYRHTRDIRIAQRVARHARIDTTTRYEHASDQEVATAVRRLAS